MAGSPNLLLLAADKPAEVLRLLQADPQLASSQDDHGYSLLHAAASYNHLDLLQALVKDFHIDINLKDEDGESALFVVETTDCARILVEELYIDMGLRGEEGKTAREKFVEDGDFPEVAAYLRLKELERLGSESHETGLESGRSDADILNAPPPLPEGLSVNVGSMSPGEAGEVENAEFRRRIDELASREDYQSEEGQRQLRELVTEALRGDISDDRQVRRRLD